MVNIKLNLARDLAPMRMDTWDRLPLELELELEQDEDEVEASPFSSLFFPSLLFSSLPPLPCSHSFIPAFFHSFR